MVLTDCRHQLSPHIYCECSAADGGENVGAKTLSILLEGYVLHIVGYESCCIGHAMRMLSRLCMTHSLAIAALLATSFIIRHCLELRFIRLIENELS